MADNVEVRLGADASGMKSETVNAAATVDRALGKIREALLGMGAAAKESEATAKESTFNIGAAFKDMKEQIGGAIESSHRTIEAFRTAFMLLAATIAGGALWHEAITLITEFQRDVETLERTLGMASDKATTFNIALKLAGSNAGDFAAIALHVGRMVKTQADEFDRLKVTIKDSNGELLPMEEIMRNIFTRMQEFKVGTDQNMVTLTLAGRAARAFAETMENLERVEIRATELQKQFGIEMGPDRQGQVKAYKTEVAAFGIAMDALAIQIGVNVMPQLQGFATWLTNEGPRAITAIVTTLKILASAFTLVEFAVSKTVITFAASLEAMQIMAEARTASIRASFSLEFGRIPGIVATALGKVVALQRAAHDSIATEQLRATDSLEALWLKGDLGTTPKVGGVKGGTKVFPLKPTGGAAAASADDRLAKWKDELVQMQEAQGYFNELSKAQEAAFWQDKLSQVTTNGDADVKLRRDLNRLIFEDKKAAAREALADEVVGLEAEKNAIQYNYAERIRLAQQAADLVAAAWGAGSRQAIIEQAKVTAEIKKAADVQRQVANLELQSKEATAKHAVDMEKLSTDQQVALRQIDMQTAFAQERAQQNGLYEIDRKAIADRRALLDQYDKIGQATLDKQLEDLERSHQAKLTEIANKAELDRKQTALQAAQAVQDAFSGLLQNLANKTMSWKDAFKKSISDLTTSLNKLASDQIAKQLFGAGTPGGSFLNNIFGKIFGTSGKDAGAAAQTEAATALTSSATMLTESGTALDLAATALQSAAMALGAKGGLGALGGLFGKGGGAGTPASEVPGSYTGPQFGEYAVGTAYVPQDSLAMVHKGEAIIPAKYNRGGAGGIDSLHQQFVINGPADTRTQYQIAEAAARGARMAMLRHGSG